MKKVLAASVGLLLTVATAAHADNWSRDRDPGNQKEASQPGGESREARGYDGGNRGGNDGGSRGYGGGRSGGNQPSPSSAMFQDVDARGSNQRSSPEYSEGTARAEAQRYDNRQQRSGGGYAAQAGGTAYQGGDVAQREGSGYRGDRGTYGGDRGGYSGGDRGGYSGGDTGGYRGGYSGGDRRYDGNRYDGNRYDGRHRDGYRNDRYDNRYRGGYSSRHGYRGGYDHYRGYRGNWNNHRYRSPWRYSYPRGFGYRSWSVGLFLPSVFYSPTYYVDYAPYGLQPPPYGYEWVRVDADVLLVEIRTGLIVDVLHGFFY